MLVPVQSKEWFLGQLARLHGGYPHMFEAERGWTENGNPPVKYFVDDAGSPRGVRAVHGVALHAGGQR